MKIGVLGLGAMGSRVAKNLKNDGHELFIYNRTISKTENLSSQGAHVCSSPEELVKNTDIIFSFLTNDQAAKVVWLGEQGGVKSLTSEKIIIESSTLSISTTQELSKVMGNNLLIAPVVGSRPQAENRELVFIVGGKERLLNRSREVIEKISSKILYLETFEKACALKLTINSLFGIQTIALAEFYTALIKSDFKKEEIEEIIPNLPVTSPIMNLMLNLFNKKMYSPLFPIDLVKKDFDYALSFLNNTGVSSTVTKSALETYRLAISKGLGEQNISGIINLFNGDSNE